MFVIGFFQNIFGRKALGDLESRVAEINAFEEEMIALSNDGMFVVVASLDTRTGKLRKSPDIISRGFIYLRENKQLLNDARTMVRDHIERSTAGSRHIDLDVLRDEVTEALTKFLLVQTNKTPIVIPVIIGF